MLAIEVESLTKSFGAHRVLDDVTFTVPNGTITALLGSNGAGKTTIIDILTTVTAADSGTAHVAGHDVSRDPRAVRRAISVTGQSASVDGMLTASENLELIGRLQGLSKADARARSRTLVDSAGLADASSKRVSTYSGGMRRKLDLALSMVRPASVVFLDEPTTGLDTRARSALWEQVRMLAATGAAVLITTQYLDEADQLADNVLVLHQGRIVERGTPAALKARVGVAEVVVTAADGVEIDREPTDGTPAGLRRALDALETRAALTTHHPHQAPRIDVRKPTLDDVFLSLTSEVTA